ncbi:MAG TPA: response regulator [Ferrovibrio sp.]|jgi:two-component system chemotaxis response regulator CheY|uniref:response regulator n=1 Tax=Ferrovibrio sp. TaxID=1917215 RepID=UPI002B4AEA80|nr:response regulator [Ferrovibrio sp.]HLT77368.1 response regulator [Ferrovibrio sp.]
MARILLVDDDSDIREVLRDHLESAGHSVVEAQNGKVGMVVLGQNPCDLVITDVYMPDGDGIEFITRLHEQAEDLPIIAMSGGGSHDFGLHMLAVTSVLGARAILAKPFNCDQLLQTVDRVLQH